MIDPVSKLEVGATGPVCAWFKACSRTAQAGRPRTCAFNSSAGAQRAKKMGVIRHCRWSPDTKRLLKVPLPGADRFRRRPLSAPWAARDRLGQAVRSPARSGARILDLVSGRACKRVLDDAADRALRGLGRVHPHSDPRGLRFAARRLRPGRATGARYTNARDTAAGSCFVPRRRWNNVLSGSHRGGRNGTRFR